MGGERDENRMEPVSSRASVSEELDCQKERNRRSRQSVDPRDTRSRRVSASAEDKDSQWQKVIKSSEEGRQQPDRTERRYTQVQGHYGSVHRHGGLPVALQAVAGVA